MRKQNINNHLTAKERTSISFPARYVQQKGLIVGKTLDFGCGFGKDVEILRGSNFDIIGYDLHYFPIYPTEKFDTILCFYVLNVLMPEEQTRVLMDISRLLKPNGKAYFAVRRDVHYEGFRMHKIHQKETYQCDVKLNFKSILINDYCEIYEYQHYNQIAHLPSDCPFCNVEKERELILETATTYAIYDKFPVNNGHALIIPKRHVSNYFDLSFKEQSACWFAVNKVKEIIEKECAPNGFNVGININEAAGQTVSHVHIHLIPRYLGDVVNSVGGVRNVIPSKGDYFDFPY